MNLQKDILCPCCQTATQWSPQNPYRPFCSASCKNRDFVDWASEAHRLSESPDYSDAMSEAMAPPDYQ